MHYFKDFHELGTRNYAFQYHLSSQANACTTDERTKRRPFHDILDHHKSAPANSVSLTPYDFWIPFHNVFAITKECVLVPTKIEALGAL